MKDWYRSVLGYSVIGAALLWAALPPLGFWPLAWIAPVWWVLLVRAKQLPLSPACRPWPLIGPLRLAIAVAVLIAAWMATAGVFHGFHYNGFWLAEIVFWPLALGLLVVAARMFQQRPYVVLWLVGWFFWLAALQWLRLPHWATGFGWLAMSLCFSFYLPVFVALSRVAVHRLRVPVIVAAPVVWTGSELARAHILTGMTMASLGHTQYRWVELIQVSDVAGAFGVSFVVMFVAACLARMIPSPGGRGGIVFWPLVPAVLMLAAVLGYGRVRTSGEYTTPGPRVALIQGCVDTEMQQDEGQREEVFRHYIELSYEALRKYGHVDLMVWPETMFLKTYVTYDEDAAIPEDCAEMTPSEFRDALHEVARRSRDAIAATARAFEVPLILGVDSQHYGREGISTRNSAVFVSADGELRGRYDKMHLVMFGEYVPCAQYWHWLHRLTPLSESATPGDKAAVFALKRGVGDRDAVRIAPNICYESVLSHVIRGQVNALERHGAAPDVLVNVSNDGWFWGSSELEMHLACGVFRAVECHKPVLIAANTGISAWIDGDGRIRAEGPCRARATRLAEVALDHRRSWYLDHGDWPAGLCLTACVIFAIVGVGAWCRCSVGSRIHRQSGTGGFFAERS